MSQTTDHRTPTPPQPGAELGADAYWASIDRKLQRAVASARSGDRATEAAWLHQATAVAEQYLGPWAVQQLAGRVESLQREGLLTRQGQPGPPAGTPAPVLEGRPAAAAVAVRQPQAQVEVAGDAARPPAQAGRLFRFDGGAATWFGVRIAGFFVTLFSLGICYPWSVVMVYRWKAKHTSLQGRPLRFTGDAWSLFGQWIKWFLLLCITLGIYSFWVYPRMTRWIVEHQEFAD